MTRQVFAFYRSFLEAIHSLPKRVQGDAALALIRYALNGEEPDENCKPGVRTLLIMAKPILDKGARRAEAGRKGGAAASNRKANNKPYTYTVAASEAEAETEAETEATPSADAETIPCAGANAETIPSAGAETNTYASGGLNAAVKAVFARLSAAEMETSRHTAEIAEYTERYGVPRIADAIGKAVDNNALSWGYVRAILDNAAKAEMAAEVCCQRHELKSNQNDSEKKQQTSAESDSPSEDDPWFYMEDVEDEPWVPNDDFDN